MHNTVILLENFYVEMRKEGGFFTLNAQTLNIDATIDSLLSICTNLWTAVYGD